MAVGKQIKVTLTLDENGFGSKTRSAATSIEQLGKSVETTGKSVQRIDNHLTSFGSKAHRMIMTLGMVRFALMDVNDIFLKLPLAILKTGGEIERLTKLMEGLSTQTDVAAKKLEAASNVKFLFNMAQNAPFEVKALADSFVKLKTGGLDPTKGALQSLVDGVAKFGGSSEQLKRASIAIQQMGGKGVISMEELRQQLGEAVPTAMRAMADGMGLTMAELTKAVSKGSVASASAMNKMLVVMGLNNAGAAAGMMTTWVGMIERLKTKWELFKLEIGGEGMFDTAKAALEGLIKGFGAASTGSLARDIGRWLNDAVVNVVALTKKIIELWDWIKIAGQAFAVYWVASKVAGPLMAAAKAVTDLRTAVTTNSRATLQAVADEGVARQRDAAARAIHLRDWMAGNTAQITAERARVLAANTAADDILRKKIAANQTEILLAKDKAVALAAIEQQIRMQAMALELQAESVARSKRAGSGASSRSISADAGRLAGNADVLRTEREALLTNAAAIATRNAAMEKSIEVSKAAGVVNNSVTQSLVAKNNVLAQAVAKHEALAQNITKVNTAASLMGGAMTAVGGFVKSMIFSMNGLIMVIMAAAYAWEYFSNKAKKAAQDAKNALELSDRVKRGVAQQENIDGAKSQIDRDRAQIASNETRIAYLLRTREKAHDKDIIDLRAQNERLVGKIAESETVVNAGIKQVMLRSANERAGDLNQMVDADVTKAMKPKLDEGVQLNLDFDKIINPNAAQKKAHFAALAKNQQETLAVKRAALASISADYKKLIADGKLTEELKLSYEQVVSKINSDEAATIAASGYLKSPNDTQDKDGAGKKKKAPQNDPTDGLLLKMDADAKFLLKAKAKMAGMTGDTLDIATLRAQAQEEIAQIMDQDRRLYTVHQPGDVEKAVDQLTDRKIMEEALREQAALFPRLESGKERLRQLNEQVATGMFNEPSNTEENKILQVLERISKMSPEAALAMAPVIKARKELLEVSAGTDVATALIAGEKSLRDQRIGGIVNDREKIAAEGKKEVSDIQTKYDMLIAQAQRYNIDTVGLQAQLTESLELQAKRQARALETPLEKLAIDWKDTTKAMGAASASAATGFVDMLVGGLEKGSLDIKGFLLSVVKDIATVQLKNSLADPLKQIFGTGASMLGNALFGKSGEDKGSENPMTDPLVSGAKAVAAMAAKSLGAGDALTSMAKGGVTDAATAAAQSAISSATSGTASTSFSSAVMQATAAVSAFAAALKNTAAGSSAADVGGGIGDLIGSLFGGSDWMAAGAQSSGAFTSGISGGSAIGTALPLLTFANGGVMTDYGSLPLRKYASGGIANSPQLALYGEAGPEAYVPLPDGRSIPVTMQGGQEQSAPSVTVNVINQSGQQVNAEKGRPRFDGKQMILDVVLTAANSPGPFRDGMKGAVGG